MNNYWQYFQIPKDCNTIVLENAYMQKFISIEENFDISNSEVIKELLKCNKAFNTLIKPNSRYEHNDMSMYFKSYGVRFEPIDIIDNVEFEEWIESTYEKYLTICQKATDEKSTWNINTMNTLQIAIGLNQIIEYIKKEKGLARIIR